MNFQPPPIAKTEDSMSSSDRMATQTTSKIPLKLKLLITVFLLLLLMIVSGIWYLNLPSPTLPSPSSAPINKAAIIEPEVSIIDALIQPLDGSISTENISANSTEVDIFDANAQLKTNIGELQTQIQQLSQDAINKQQWQQLETSINIIQSQLVAFKKDLSVIDRQIIVLDRNSQNYATLKQQVDKLSTLKTTKSEKPTPSPAQTQRINQNQLVTNIVSISLYAGVPQLAITNTLGQREFLRVGDYINREWEIHKISVIEQSALVSNGRAVKTLRLSR